MGLEERLRDLRQEKELSQADLAEIMGVSRQAVSRWETGAAAPSVENLIELSRLYGVPLDELVRGGAAPEEEAAPPVPVPPAGAAPKKGRRMEAWLAALLCLLALAAGIALGRATAPEESDVPAILDMADMEGEEVEIIPGNTFSTEALPEGR